MNLAHRLYSDFILPDRFGEYDRLLSMALDYGYEVLSIERMWRLIESECVDPDRSYLILRHDIDTDPEGAEKFLELETKWNVTASYYFRLSTIDVALMKRIAAQGGEASYHFEELATYCKAHGVKSAGEVKRRLPEIEAMFSENLVSLRQKTELPLTIVASHGDWVNRKVGLTNAVITENRALRGRLGIELEVYDDNFMRHVTKRFSDRGYPAFWKSNSVATPLELKSRVVYILTHPRHWRANVAANGSENWSRLMEEMRYRFPW